MNFFDTVLGHRFAEVLINELPKLNNNLEKLINCNNFSDKEAQDEIDEIKQILNKVKKGE